MAAGELVSVVEEEVEIVEEEEVEDDGEVIMFSTFLLKKIRIFKLKMFSFYSQTRN